jgi:hypothetical protein
VTLYGASLIFSLLFLGVIYVVAARKVWRGESGLDGDVPPAWWFLGDEWWRGVARGYIASVPFLLVALVGGIVAEFTDDFDLGMSIAVLGLLAGVALNLCIVAFNRPRSLVPPHLRSEPGALAARRAHRARRTRRAG